MKRFTAALLILLSLAAIVHAGIPVPSSLSDPTTRAWFKVEFPLEVRGLTQKAMWDRYPHDRPANASGTATEMQALVYDKILELIEVNVAAYLEEHGEIPEGATVAEKQALIKARVAAVMAEVRANTVVTSGP